jgi:hypothetical protein
MMIRRKDDIVFPVYKRTSSRLLAEFRARKHVTDGRYVPLASPRGFDSRRFSSIDICRMRSKINFDDFWMTKLKAPSIGPTVAAMESGDVETLKRRVRASLPADTEGRITYGARAHAIKGHRAK